MDIQQSDRRKFKIILRGNGIERRRKNCRKVFEWKGWLVGLMICILEEAP